ncbi:hypothetical protein MWN34_00135 [Ancylobacter sp. 6x-1]|uniref:Uncharacterized protein n=1 Tax=Ancylobacter crimeensis TaxID=2579147 RepID=A0ABT0D5T8_9HYPH|nr:hypothetical protein [Ancylobacter crimeensis]MCK0195316.1 hypothetical protein [Ancylobacter crimeensis]
MPGTYRIEPLHPARVDQAYTLMRLIAPGLDLSDWRDFCRTLSAPCRARSCSAVVVCNPRAYVQGLCMAQARQIPGGGPVIEVPVLLAASAADPEGVEAALTTHLTGLTGQHGGCPLRIWKHHPTAWRRLGTESAFSDEEYVACDAGLRLPGESLLSPPPVR